MSMQSVPAVHERHTHHPVRQRVLVILLAATMTALAASLYTQFCDSSGDAVPYVVGVVSEPFQADADAGQHRRGSQLHAAVGNGSDPLAAEDTEDADEVAEAEAADDALEEAEEEAIRQRRVQAWCAKWHPRGDALAAQQQHQRQQHQQEQRQQQAGDKYLALCLAINDLHRDVREWLAHHRVIGVGKVYLYDTGSSPPLNQTLLDFITDGFVEYAWRPLDLAGQNGSERAFPQRAVWEECIAQHRSQHQFLGFIDSDEFLVLKDDEFPSVPALLRRLQACEPIGGLAVNWVIFGTSGHRLRPVEGVLQSYTQCLPHPSSQGRHVKIIANTDFLVKPNSRHEFQFSDGKFAVNEHFRRVNGPLLDDYTVDSVQLNHYTTKSHEEFWAKQGRHSTMGKQQAQGLFNSIERQAVAQCTGALKYGPYVSSEDGDSVK